MGVLHCTQCKHCHVDKKQHYLTRVIIFITVPGNLVVWHFIAILNPSHLAYVSCGHRKQMKELQKKQNSISALWQPFLNANVFMVKYANLNLIRLG